MRVTCAVLTGSTAAALARQASRKRWEVLALFVCIYKVAGNFQGILRSDNNTVSVGLSASINFLQTVC